MLFSACADTNDQSLGPNVLGCRGDFDFTVKFEQLCFSLTPAAIFILASPWRVAHLVRKPTIVGAPLLRLAKLGVLVSYASLELSQLILITVLPFGASGIDIISSALRLAAALCMVGLSYFDHSKSPRPSIFLSAYLFFTLLFDVAQARTYWLASSTRPEIAFTAIFTAALTMKVAMLLLEAQRKTKWVAWDSKDHSPEETSGIYTLGVFSWLNKLFFDGYHKTLGIRDLYPLDQNLAATRLSERFSRHINEAKHKGHEIGLMEALAKTLLVPMILPIPAKLAAIGSFFCQPLFISSLTSRLSQSEPVPVNIGYGFIGASICIYSVIAISQSLYWYFQQRLLYMMRACLATAIYTKTTEARAADEDENASLTLMSIDIERIMKGSLYMHELWGNVIEVALSAWLLYNLLGVAFIAPIVVVFICVGGVSFFMRFMGDSQRKWMAGIQKRVGLTSSVIGNMKNIKISGLTSPISRFVQKLRVDELQAGSNFRLLMLTCSVFSYIPLLLSPPITFGVAR